VNVFFAVAGQNRVNTGEVLHLLLFFVGVWDFVLFFFTVPYFCLDLLITRTVSCEDSLFRDPIDKKDWSSSGHCLHCRETYIGDNQ